MIPIFLALGAMLFAPLIFRLVAFMFKSPMHFVMSFALLTYVAYTFRAPPAPKHPKKGTTVTQYAPH